MPKAKTEAGLELEISGGICRAPPVHAQEFPEFDKELMESMMLDQGGDLKEAAARFPLPGTLSPSPSSSISPPLFLRFPTFPFQSISFPIPRLKGSSRRPSPSPGGTKDEFRPFRYSPRMAQAPLRGGQSPLK